jgi:hypothetical protein
MQGVLTKKFNILYEQIYGNRLVDKLMSKNYKFFLLGAMVICCIG